MQDRDDIPDHGPEADDGDSEVEDAPVPNEEEDEGEGEDLLGDNMWKCAASSLSLHAFAMPLISIALTLQGERVVS